MKEKLKIVILEDENIVAYDIREILTRAGHSVSAILHSGSDAVRKILEIKPDLLIIDIHLKGNLDGAEIAERISLVRNVPVIFLTGDVTLPPMKYTDAYGFICKPFSSPELLHTVDLAYNDFVKANSPKNKQKDTDMSDVPIVSMIDDLTEKITHSESLGKITELVEALKDINANFQSYIFGSEISLLLIDREGKIVYTNDNFAAHLGHPCSGITNKSIFDFVNFDDAGKLLFMMEHYSTNKDKGMFFDLKCRHIDNHWVDMHCFTEGMVDSKGLNYLGVVSINNNSSKILNELIDKINIHTYENGLLEITSFLKGIRNCIREGNESSSSRHEEASQRFRRSIFSLIGYADYLISEIDNLSVDEIKTMAGKINAYLKIIYNLTQEEEKVS